MTGELHKDRCFECGEWAVQFQYVEEGCPIHVCGICGTGWKAAPGGFVGSVASAVEEGNEAIRRGDVVDYGDYFAQFADDDLDDDYLIEAIAARVRRREKLRPFPDNDEDDK